ncbi:protein-disulfide bond corrector protein DsbC [Thauera chlorobenzoica]|uniref:Protein-disulfide bond corrector protein DsbC n=1 Tax=Thauera chlorobenzoica TaxID=96773 RepID=A0A1L6FAV5_9RHOO|nr:protein-disulfide bond corrector protein DsbC [Thauera chlorobenzoica]
MPHLLLHRTLWLLAMLASLFASAAHANPIAPEKAFALRAQALDAQTVEVVFEVTKDYYLYGDKFRFEAEPATVVFGTPEKPAGERHRDEFFGEVETHRGELRILLPVQAPAGLTRFELIATSQGCWDGGICYPPTTQSAAIDLAAPRNRPQAASSANCSAATPPRQPRPPPWRPSPTPARRRRTRSPAMKAATSPASSPAPACR